MMSRNDQIDLSRISPPARPRAPRPSEERAQLLPEGGEVGGETVARLHLEVVRHVGHQLVECMRELRLPLGEARLRGGGEPRRRLRAAATDWQRGAGTEGRTARATWGACALPPGNAMHAGNYRCGYAVVATLACDSMACARHAVYASSAMSMSASSGRESDHWLAQSSKTIMWRSVASCEKRDAAVVTHGWLQGWLHARRRGHAGGYIRVVTHGWLHVWLHVWLVVTRVVTCEAKRSRSAPSFERSFFSVSSEISR